MTADLTSEQRDFLAMNQRFLIIASQHRQFQHYVDTLGLRGKTCVYLATDEPGSIAKCHGRDPNAWAVLRVGEYARGRCLCDLIDALQASRFTVFFDDDRNGFYR